MLDALVAAVAAAAVSARSGPPPPSGMTPLGPGGGPAALGPDMAKAVLSQLQSCPEESLGVFSELRVLDLSYDPEKDEGMPSKTEVLRTFKSGTSVEVDQGGLEGLAVRFAPLSQRLQEVVAGSPP